MNINKNPQLIINFLNIKNIKNYSLELDCIINPAFLTALRITEFCPIDLKEPSIE